MSKIAFFCIPAHGHTNPTLGVVRELVSRGHEVWYYSYNMMREKIEATGAKFISCDDYDMEQKLNPKDAERIGKDLAFSTQILVDTTLALDDKVCADMEQFCPDCIVADSMAVWGKAAAMKLGVQFVSSTTTFAFNEHSAKIMKQSAGEVVRMILAMPKIMKHIKRLQAKGYPIKNVLDILQNDNDTHTIVYTSTEFQPCAETFSDKYAFVGPSIRPVGDEFAKQKETLVYISMGTVNNDMVPLYKNCIDALAHTEYQVVLSVGNLVQIDTFGILPDNISVCEHVDQIAVLQKADVFLSHCGMNSVNESLYFGVPLLMLPQTTEQGGVAERVRELGAGMKLQKHDAQSILDGINTLLHNPSFRACANAISTGFKQCSGAKGAADKIEQVCKLG